MEPSAVKSSLPIDVRQQITTCCQEFERAWKDGNTPSLGDFVRRVTKVGQGQLLHELLILELQYRRDGQGAPLSDSRLCELHAELMPAIAEQLQLLRQPPSIKTTEALTMLLPSSAEVYETVCAPQPIMVPR